jgi:putative MFS transporter
MSKYLQEVHHYRPFQVTILYLAGGMLSVWGVIIAGRLSDSLGRKRILLAAVILAGASFGVLYSGMNGPIVAVAWILAIFGYLSSEALFSGYPAEIFPTAYRATTSTLRYVASTLGGALALALEGTFYDRFGAHAPAVMLILAATPIAVIAVLFLPETARRTLEDIAEEPLEIRKA